MTSSRFFILGLLPLLCFSLGSSRKDLPDPMKSQKPENIRDQNGVTKPSSGGGFGYGWGSGGGDNNNNNGNPSCSDSGCGGGVRSSGGGGGRGGGGGGGGGGFGYGSGCVGDENCNPPVIPSCPEPPQNGGRCSYPSQPPPTCGCPYGCQPPPTRGCPPNLSCPPNYGCPPGIGCGNGNPTKLTEKEDQEYQPTVREPAPSEMEKKENTSSDISEKEKKTKGGDMLTEFQT